MIESELVQVAVEAPLPQLLTYRLPDALRSAEIGSQVWVPLGKRRSKGVLISPTTESNLNSDKIRNVAEIISSPPLGDKTRKWLEWLARYYLHPPGQVYALAFAPGDEKRKRKSGKSPVIADVGRQVAPNPTADQAKAIDAIQNAIVGGKFQPFLLYGVTGSGKTEVYLSAIEKVLSLGKQALVLVPEISLTPQLSQRFVSRFGDNVALLHSHLTTRERADQWWSAVKGQKKILVGARSALFCPLENLGLIVVDEEHENSFKQEEQLKYNARDAAIMRAQISSCPIVLGSATPSLESWQNALGGKFQCLELSSRVEDRPMPLVEVIDMRKERRRENKTLPYWMSEVLFQELNAKLQNQEQSALFLNRRGFAQFLICPACGFSEICPHCSVTLTVHDRGKRLLCHYCGFQKPRLAECSSCRQDDLKSFGLGTEKISEDLKILFPEARIARADRDEINSREKLERLLSSILSHQVDMIVGTQMIAKGHDFPNLTLVGVVLADIGLHLPDFRSSEKTFQLLAQVAGRAGRHDKSGKVIIQTFSCEHSAIQNAITHNFKSFAQQELLLRAELSYPPFGKLACVRVQGPNEAIVEGAAEKVGKILKQISREKFDILGPCEAALAKLKGKYRYQILVKSKSATDLNVFLQKFLNDLNWLQGGTKVSVDVDPIHLL